MNKKFLSNFAAVCLSLLLFCLNADAAVTSKTDIYNKAVSINKVSQFDFSSFIPKQEVIGDRKTNFNLITEMYKKEASVATEDLRRIIVELENLEGSAQQDTQEKQQQLYNQADRIIYDFDSKSYAYIMRLESVLPSITYI
ncbi:MAG: hypothetical protein LUG16_09010, partial [Candidatus Gastranaerophilales bacterium]|nr:hypothetical protein [Candidatus Gastranaerophilales bacterium]